MSPNRSDPDPSEQHFSEQNAPENRSLDDVLKNEKLRYLSGDDVPTVASGTPVREVLQFLSGDAGRSAVVVVDKLPGGMVKGIFTERDYLDHIAASSGSPGSAVDGGAPIDNLMTRDPRVVSPDDTTGRAIQLMTQGGYRHLPVADDRGRLLGLVSTRDIVVYLAEFFPMEVYNLPPRLHQNETIDTREGG